MAKEIERKFLVSGNRWRRDAVGVRIRQGYLVAEERLVVRVRIAGPEATLTIKAPAGGITRREFEVPIPLEDAAEMLEELCEERIVSKTRYRVPVGGEIWEVDEFHGDNEGLVLAEIELGEEDAEVEPPEWVGSEVTDDPSYTNAVLAQRPWKDRTATASDDSTD